MMVPTNGSKALTAVSRYLGYGSISSINVTGSTTIIDVTTESTSGSVIVGSKFLTVTARSGGIIFEADITESYEDKLTEGLEVISK